MMSEARKAISIKIDNKWLVTDNKDIKSHIKFLPSYN
jgi:hypothetical protein